MLSIDHCDLWQKVLLIIEKQVSKAAFETWLKPTRPLRFDYDTLVIKVPNGFAKDWLEARYCNMIKESLKKVTNQELGLAFVLPDSVEPLSNQGVAGAGHTFPPSLNPRYTFETFVVGSSNKFAHAAALAAAGLQAQYSNPLFIYGGVGLGKTHLIQAVGNLAVQNNPGTKVLYVSAERFVNELLNSIRDDMTVNFRDKYRSLDMLIIDDVHFLAGKERTQEELFHTFNALYEANQQIIISSAQPPREIPVLAESLRSRFEGGLMAEIKLPDIETRTTILQKRIQFENLQIPDDVINYIAEQFHANIRELQGALTKVILYASVAQRQISLDLAGEALQY